MEKAFGGLEPEAEAEAEAEAAVGLGTGLGAEELAVDEVDIEAADCRSGRAEVENEPWL